MASTAWHIAFVDGLDGSSCVQEPELPADVQLRSSTQFVRSPTAEVDRIQRHTCLYVRLSPLHDMAGSNCTHTMTTGYTMVANTPVNGAPVVLDVQQ